jgi:hypothetical protein
MVESSSEAVLDGVNPKGRGMYTGVIEESMHDGAKRMANASMSPDTPPIDAILPRDGDVRWFPDSRRRAGDVCHVGGLQRLVDT